MSPAAGAVVSEIGTTICRALVCCSSSTQHNTPRLAGEEQKQKHSSLPSSCFALCSAPSQRQPNRNQTDRRLKTELTHSLNSTRLSTRSLCASESCERRRPSVACPSSPCPCPSLPSTPSGPVCPPQLTSRSLPHHRVLLLHLSRTHRRLPHPSTATPRRPAAPRPATPPYSPGP